MSIIPSGQVVKHTKDGAPYSSVTLNQIKGVVYNTNGVLQGLDVRISGTDPNVSPRKFNQLGSNENEYVTVEITTEQTIALPGLSYPYALYVHNADSIPGSAVTLSFGNTDDLSDSYVILADFPQADTFIQPKKIDINNLAMNIQSGVSHVYYDDSGPLATFTFKLAPKMSTLYNYMLFGDGKALYRDSSVAATEFSENGLSTYDLGASSTTCEIIVSSDIKYQEEAVANGTDSIFNFSHAIYVPGTDDLLVFHNGLLQPQSAYTETDENTITFGAPPSVGTIHILVLKNKARRFVHTATAGAEQTFDGIEFDYTGGKYYFVTVDGVKSVFYKGFNISDIGKLLFTSALTGGESIEVIEMQALTNVHYNNEVWKARGAKASLTQRLDVAMDEDGNVKPSASLDSRYIRKDQADTTANPLTVNSTFTMSGSGATAAILTDSGPQIRKSTNTGSIALCGGTQTLATTGAFIELYGITHASTGNISVVAGNPNGEIVMSTGGASRIKLNSVGELEFTSANLIKQDNDSGYMTIAGGSDAAIGNGGFIRVHGNASANTGNIEMAAGNGATKGDIMLQTAGVDRIKLNSNGALEFANANLIKQNNDSEYMTIAGGSDAAIGNGGFIRVYGNASANTGNIEMAAGSPDGEIVMTTGGSSRIKLTSAGALEFTNANQIKQDDDSEYMTIAGGSDADVSYGGVIRVYGNSHANTGDISIGAGNAGGNIIMATNGVARVTIDSAGTVTLPNDIYANDFIPNSGTSYVNHRNDSTIHFTIGTAASNAAIGNHQHGVGGYSVTNADTVDNKHASEIVGFGDANYDPNHDIIISGDYTTGNLFSANGNLPCMVFFQVKVEHDVDSNDYDPAMIIEAYVVGNEASRVYDRQNQINDSYHTLSGVALLSAGDDGQCEVRVTGSMGAAGTLIVRYVNVYRISA